MYCLSHLILDDPALEGATLIHADDDERLGQVEDAIAKLVTESRFEIRAAWNQLVERGRECRAEEEKQAEEEEQRQLRIKELEKKSSKSKKLANQEPSRVQPARKKNNSRV